GHDSPRKSRVKSASVGVGILFSNSIEFKLTVIAFFTVQRQRIQYTEHHQCAENRSGGTYAINQINLRPASNQHSINTQMVPGIGKESRAYYVADKYWQE